MQEVRTAAHRRGTRLALVAVAVALFGLMSMHGWGSHAGAHPMGAGSQGVMPVMNHIGANTPASMAVDDSDGAVAGHQSQAPDGDEGGGLLGLCLAILAGLIVGVALALTRRGIRVLSSLLPTWPSPVRYGRDRDPPDLLRLCVIRC